MSDYRCHQQMSGELHPSQCMLSRSSESYTLSLFSLSSWASSLHQKDAAVSVFDKISFLFPLLILNRYHLSKLTELIRKQMAPSHSVARCGRQTTSDQMCFYNCFYSQSILEIKSSRKGLVHMSQPKGTHLQSLCSTQIILFTWTPICFF